MAFPLKSQTIHEHLTLYGPEELTALQLLAFLLADRPQTQNTLLTRLTQAKASGQWGGSLAQVEALCQELSLTARQTERLLALRELFRRFAHQGHEAHPLIRSADELAALFRPQMAYLDHEEMRVICLDSKYHVRANLLLYRGTANSAGFRAAEVFRPAIVRNCPFLALAHNHPSTDPTPSAEDVAVTEQLVEAGNLLHIEVLDHLIIGNPRYVSLKQILNW